MQSFLFICLALTCSLFVFQVSAQTTTPCGDINVQTYTIPADTRWTSDPNFDQTIPADSKTVDASADNQYLFPLGFRKAQIYEDNEPPFCVKIPNVGKKKVEIMVQTVQPQARLCVKDYGSAIDRCFNDRLTACFGSLTYQTDPMTIVFYCEGGCQTGFTTFWYRIRTSTVTYDTVPDRESATKSLEMWCMMQDQLADGSTRFPSDLVSDIVLVDVQKTSDLSAANTNMGSMLIMSVISVIAVLVQKMF